MVKTFATLCALLALSAPEPASALGMIFGDEVIVIDSSSSTNGIDYLHPTHEVKKGDTLWNIAKKNCRDEHKYKNLANYNNLRNVNLLKPGQRVDISYFACNYVKD